jgi:hypothetical protein
LNQGDIYPWPENDEMEIIEFSRVFKFEKE